MADADTIVILDNLKHTQEVSATLFTIDSATASNCKTWPIHIPLSASQARVIFNNNYDADGMAVAVRVRVTKVTGMTTTGITKTENTEALAWTLIPGNVTDGTDIVETGTIDVSGSRATTLHIDMAIAEAGAHTGTEIEVQVASEAAVDDSWTTIGGGKFVGPTGTVATAGVVHTESASGQKVISLTNPVASGFDWVGKWIFILNNTVANSEMVYEVEFGADA